MSRIPVNKYSIGAMLIAIGALLGSDFGSVLIHLGKSIGASEPHSVSTEVVNGTPPTE